MLLYDSFKTKDLGNLKYFFRLEIARTKEVISLCQRKYALALLDRGYLATKVDKTPWNILLKSLKIKAFHDISSYKCLVGQLLYLTTTRPNFPFITHQLSQFLFAPTYLHKKLT